MASTDPSTTSTGTPSEGSALARAAQDMEALTKAYDDCTRSLEDTEATVDALLDDPEARVLVADGEQRVVALSRGMAEVVGHREPVLGRAVVGVVPESWRGVDAMMRDLSAGDGWREMPVADGSGRLCLRRVSENDRAALVIVRYDPGTPVV